MELNRSPTPCSATSRKPFSKPVKSKRLLTKPSHISWCCSKSGHREGRGGCRPSADSLVRHRNPSKAIGDLCRSVASQGLSLFVTAGDVNDRESIAECFLSHAVVWQEQQVGLMALVWYRHVEFRPWYVPWSRQIDLSYGLLLEPVLGCCSVTLDAA